MTVALVTEHIDDGFFAADGGIELVLLLGGASLALALTTALDLPQQLRTARTRTRTRDLTRHSPRRHQAFTRGG